MPRTLSHLISTSLAILSCAAAVSGCASGCDAPTLCDLDGDGLCPPDDCDDYDAAVQDCVDKDRDGYSEEDGDCDDSNAEVYPHAEEDCTDGIDNNCNGLVDGVLQPESLPGGEAMLFSGMKQSPVSASLVSAAIMLGTGTADSDGCSDTGVDWDNDGVGSPDDCDPFDSDVYPGAPELCDGLDNDCDGTVDEGATITVYFDGDGDGYGVYGYEACELPDGYVLRGGDCDDSDADVHPNAPEGVDGLDNDCDGTVDEAQSAYTLAFLETRTRLPIEGVVVWFGMDGTGPFAWTDANGEVVFYLETPRQSWSFALAFPYNGYEQRRIFSYLNDTLEPTMQVTLWNGGVTSDTRSLSGTVTGVEPSADSAVIVSSVGVSSDALAASSAEVPFQIDPYVSNASYLLATETPFNEVYGDYLSTDIPSRFNVILEPPDPTTIALNRTFDQLLTLAPGNLDARIDGTFHELLLPLEGDAGRLEFTRQTDDLSDPAGFEMPIPTFTSPLAGAELYANFMSDEGDVSQGFVMPWSSGSGTLSIDLPDIHPVAAGYTPLAASTLEGSSVDVLGLEGCDQEEVAYMDVERVEDTGEQYLHLWSVYQDDPSQAVTFPAIPAGAYQWPDEGGGSRETLVQYGYSFARYGVNDDSPGSTESMLALEVSSDASAGTLLKGTLSTGTLSTGTRSAHAGSAGKMTAPRDTFERQRPSRRMRLEQPDVRYVR